MFLGLVKKCVARHTKTVKRVPRSGSHKASGKLNPEGPVCLEDPNGPDRAEAPEVPELTSLCPYSPNGFI